MHDAAGWAVGVDARSLDDDDNDVDDESEPFLPTWAVRVRSLSPLVWPRGCRLAAQRGTCAIDHPPMVDFSEGVAGAGGVVCDGLNHVARDRNNLHPHTLDAVVLFASPQMFLASPD
jgi:hypothetical protein